MFTHSEEFRAWSAEERRTNTSYSVHYWTVSFFHPETPLPFASSAKERPTRSRAHINAHSLADIYNSTSGSRMSSWVLLLVCLLAACLRFGATEGDVLPSSLVDLVRNSPIQELQMLLLSDSVVDSDSDSPKTNDIMNRLPRSLEAVAAQQAVCKVRTEVVEVTRAMLDRTNADFLLWPPCVEVQRCSGCCNTRNLQCVPVTTHTRHLQVMKIQYVRKRPVYDKAVVSVFDHVECQCQPRRKHTHSVREKHTHSGSEKERVAKSQSVEQLKLHQLEALWSQPWDSSKHHMFINNNGSKQTNYTATKQTDTHFTHPNHTVSSEPEEEEEKEGGMERRSEHNEDAKEQTSQNQAQGSNLANQTSENKQRHKDTANQRLDDRVSPSEMTGQNCGQKPNSVEEANQSLGQQHNHVDVTNEREDHRLTDLETTNQSLRDNETPPSVKSSHTLESERQALEEEKSELLSLHRRLDEERKLLKQQHRDKQQTYTTTLRTVSGSSRPVRPAPPRSAPKTPVRTPRKRQRKHRHRISKAAMRAMLM
ncbi:uncharacterized protein pdgfbb [Chanos chanos]|uniref:Platelet-derived growth factor subunit B n=1 Tax=Chanos chanos TaxID=29144 RepID=A0A6J2WY47_CHACN|nr:uncharacterized protein LOC115829294 [Chanos chanos]